MKTSSAIKVDIDLYVSTLYRNVLLKPIAQELTFKHTLNVAGT